MRDTITLNDNNSTQTALTIPTAKVNHDNLTTQCTTTPQRSPSINSQYSSNKFFDLESNNITATPAPTTCTCRKLLSRQPQITRHCCCNKTTNQPNNKANALETADYYGYFCEPQPPAKQYQQLRLENLHCEHQKNSAQSIPKMLTEPNNNHDNINNTESHNGGGSDHGNDDDDFNVDSIDPEEAYYREKVFWCLERKSKLRHWAIRMTLSPYLFQLLFHLIFQYRVVQKKYY